MNKISLVGRLTKDVELSATKNGKSYCRFSVASREKGKDSEGKEITNFFNCTAWNEKAKLIQKFCKKGDRISLYGYLVFKKFNDKQYAELTVEEVEFINNTQQHQEEGYIEQVPIMEEELPF